MSHHDHIDQIRAGHPANGACCSGKHWWIDEVGASRCCSPGWRRELRPYGFHHDLDDKGRIYQGLTVAGWVRV